MYTCTFTCKQPKKMFIAVLICVVCLMTSCQSAVVPQNKAECGYGSCNPVKDGMINVHLVPHTHDDVGWLKTVDQYFYGSRNNIQNAGVQYVLDSVIPQLLADPTKRFIYVEIAFFARWWREQHDSMRHVVKGLVNSGQLEFILGGWCMNDEAATHYNAIIDQHSLGFEFLRQNFGECGRPKIGWQIDPFGHSREQASLFAQFGFDGLFFGRLDFQDKNERLKNITMEMLWHGSPENLGDKADLFTGVFFNHYNPPDGFCFDIWCNDDPIQGRKQTCLQVYCTMGMGHLVVSVLMYSVVMIQFSTGKKTKLETIVPKTFSEYFTSNNICTESEVWTEYTIEIICWLSNCQGQKADLFTGVLPNLYQPPSGFCFDVFCDDEPIMDDPRLHDYNVDQKIKDFVKAVELQAMHYKTNHIIMTMGSDFQYQSAQHWYKNMDKLIKYTNMLQTTNDSKINVLYSTPSCYLYQLNQATQTWPTKYDDFFPYGIFPHGFLTGFFSSRPSLKHYIRETNNFLQQETNHSNINVLYSTPSCYLYQLNRADQQWPTKSDDFFPYAHANHSFWTGYFTSRAALKGYVRETNTFLQACKQLDALAMLEDMDNSTYNIQILREAMGVAQHHDAVSGTEKQQVAFDYAMRLAHGRAECQKVMNDAFGKLIPKGSEGFPGLVWCDLYNISACQFTEVNKQFVMVVYNPIGHSVSRWIRLPVIGKAYTVVGPNNEVIETQISPVTERTKEIPERKGSMAVNDLIFKVKLPPLGFSTYFIKMSNSDLKKKQQKAVKKVMKESEEFVMKNEHMSVRFDGRTGILKGLSNLASGLELDVHQDIVFYYAHPGNCSKPEFEPSGAYIFRPNTSVPETWKMSYPGSSEQGPLVQEVYAKFSPWVTQVTRMYSGEKYVEIEWTVGPIPIDDKGGKEVIARFNTSLNTNKMFYTDANGREILMRKRDYRPTWKLNQTEPVAGNYYPVNSRIFIQDESQNKQFTVMTDRSQGGSSIYDGQIEVMLHRRLLHDDCLGVGEPLNETGADGKGLIVRGKMYIFMDSIANSGKMHRDMGLRQYMAPIPSFTTTDMKYSEYSQYFHTSWSALNTALPPNVHMLTLEQWGGPSIEPSATQPYLIRLEHFYEKGEDEDMSKPVTVSLQNLFVPFNIESVEELTLGANLAMSKLDRLKWKTEEKQIITDKENVYIVENREPLMGPLDVMLNPMEIRTFQVTLKNGKPYKPADKFTVFS